MWDCPLLQDGGTASDVFLVHALEALNQTLGGTLEVIHGTTSTVTPMTEEGTGTRTRQGLQCESVADVLDQYAQQMMGPPAETTTSSTELLYLETYDKELESILYQKLSEKQHIHTVQAFGKSQTLLDYSDVDAVQLLLRQAIQKHPFASPLIPFVDFVVESLSDAADQPQQSDNRKDHDLPQDAATVDVSAYYFAKSLQPMDASPSSSTTVPLSFLSIQEDLIPRVGTTRHTDWGTSILQKWPATEEAAAAALQDFGQSQYAALLAPNPQPTKKRPNHVASYLSPYLSRGLLSPHQVYRALQTVQQQQHQSATTTTTSEPPQSSGSNSFLRRLAWRDYAYAASLAFPRAVRDQQPIRSGYSNSDASKDDDTTLQLSQHWKDGTTGFPLVDAGMRQLVWEGYMPQQVRLAVSACLVEGLNVPWQRGLQHFAEYLVDYDPVINTHMWMNAGGVGLDPYYIGLDYKQRPYWDADGSYVRTWCPELGALPDRVQVPPTTKGTGGTNTVDALYTPWKAPLQVLAGAKVTLGDTYPHRVVDERDGRRRFLQRLRQCRSSWPASQRDGAGNDVILLGGEPIGAFTPRALKL